MGNHLGVRAATLALAHMSSAYYGLNVPVEKPSPRRG